MSTISVWVRFGSITFVAVSLLWVEPWFGLTLVTFVGVIAGGQLWSRAAARRRIDDGAWRVRIWRGRSQLVGLARRGLGWNFNFATVDLVPGPDGLVLTPSPGAHRIGHRTRTVPWDDIVSVEERELGYCTPDTKLAFTKQTQLAIAFTGELVPPFARPDFELAGTDEPEPDPSELATAAERYRVDFHHIFGDDATVGTYPVTMTSDAPRGLAAAIRARARGVPLT